GGPVLESVHQQMKHHFEEHGTMDCLFDQVEDLEDKEIRPYLTKTYRDYQTAKKQDLTADCLHDDKIKFTNAVSSEIDSKIFISELFQNLQLTCQETELEKLFKKEHFHFVQNPYTIEKIKKLVNNPYLDYNKLCQIPLGKEPRLYGNLQKLKHTNLYLFKALIFDPNHLIYEGTKFNKLKNMTCLFSESNCSET
ncbi:4058_t:CDS:2, partial [Funneliformis geosporum]